MLYNLDVSSDHTTHPPPFAPLLACVAWCLLCAPLCVFYQAVSDDEYQDYLANKVSGSY